MYTHDCFSLYCITDPGITIVTEDIEEFLNGIRGLRARGGFDCPEPSIGAVIRAIRESERGSPIFVYTDADASDPGRLAELRALIRRNRNRVNYVLTGNCFGRKRSAGQHDTEQHDMEQYLSNMRSPRQVEDLYSLIAAISGGLVLNVDEFEISGLSSFISFSLLQATTTIFYRTSSIRPGIYDFPVDETISRILIAVNGRDLMVTVTTPEGEHVAILGVLKF